MDASIAVLKKKAPPGKIKKLAHANLKNIPPLLKKISPLR
jgi:hypothetical protein